MDKNKTRMTTKRIVLIAIFSAILFAQEEALTILPNVQFTQCLIAIYYYSFGLVDTLIIVTIHTLLDNLVMGSFNLMYTPAMLIGWISLPLILHLFRKIKNRWFISAIVGLHGLIYSWIFVFVSVVLYKVEFLPYFLADIPFEIILVVCGFVTTFLLIEPLTKVLRELRYGKENEVEENIEKKENDS